MSFFSRHSTKSASSSVTGSAQGKQAPEPTHKIFTVPPQGLTPKKKHDYNEEQLKKIAELREYTSTLMLPESNDYYPWEARFLADPGCHPRYMRAAKWKMPDAKNRIKGTIEWRRDFRPELISPDDIAVEAETGKIILSGFDEDARPLLYLRPGRENTEPSQKQIQHMIYHLERAIDFMPPGQEQCAIIVDYASATSQSMPSIGTGRKVLSILQNHYVERLGRGLVVNTSWWINAFFSGISPLMDPLTRDKIRFNPNLVELVPAEQLDWEFGGQYHLDFDHAEYWKTIIEFCHLAGDGTRIDNEGNKWYPPLGNGIKAASEGLVPRKDATGSGDAVKADDPDADTSVPGVQSAAVAGDAETKEQEEEKTRAQRIAEEHKEKEAAEGEAQGKNEDEELASGMKGASLEETTSGEGNVDVPAVDTKPGHPVGDVAFDHPPSKDELKQAEKLMA